MGQSYLIVLLTTCLEEYSKNRLKRDAGFLSYLFGEGQKIERTREDLNELTETYNTNFVNIGKDEKVLSEKLNQLVNKEKKIERREKYLQTELRIQRILNNIKFTRLDFEIIRTSQIKMLGSMLEKSVITTTLENLERGLLEKKERRVVCKKGTCIANIKIKYAAKSKKVEIQYTLYMAQIT